MAHSLSAAATQVTLQELQDERAAHRRAADEIDRLGFLSLQLEENVAALLEERHALVELQVEERAQHHSELNAAVAELQHEVAEWRSNSARSPRLTSVSEDSPAATDPRDGDCERKLAVSEGLRKVLEGHLQSSEEHIRSMVPEIAALREQLESDTARSPRLTSVLEVSSAATDPCGGDCERRLAASES